MATMKNVLEGMPLTKREALGRLYESADYGVLKEALQLLRRTAGEWALQAPDWDETLRLQGQALGLKQLHQNLKSLNKVTNEEIDKGKKSKS